MTKLLVSCALAAMTFAAAPQALKAADTDGQCLAIVRSDRVQKWQEAVLWLAVFFQ